MGLDQDATGNDLTYRIIGAAMTVHNRLGPGFKEEVYQKALFFELQQCGIAAELEFPVNVYYQDTVVGTFFLDLWVENFVVVEVKALSHLLTNDELSQVINYLKAAEAPVGLLFNFGRRALEYRRIFPPKSDQDKIQRVGRDDGLRKMNEKKP